MQVQSSSHVRFVFVIRKIVENDPDLDNQAIFRRTMLTRDALQEEQHTAG
jgi:hypothetical protein